MLLTTSQVSKLRVLGFYPNVKAGTNFKYHAELTREESNALQIDLRTHRAKIYKAIKNIVGTNLEKAKEFYNSDKKAFLKSINLIGSESLVNDVFCFDYIFKKGWEVSDFSK